MVLQLSLAVIVLQMVLYLGCHYSCHSAADAVVLKLSLAVIVRHDGVMIKLSLADIVRHDGVVLQLSLAVIVRQMVWCFSCH